MDARTAQPAALSHAEVRGIILGVLLAVFLAALDQTIVATALPTIGRELGNFEDMPWVVTAYLVAATAVTPLYGKLSDIHGRRVTLLVAIATFILGSIACALAPTMIALIVARAVQGLGGGGLISLAQTVAADVAAPRERGRYQAYFASVFAASSLLGPVLGGVIADHLHWSLIFWVNLPLGVLAFLMSNAALKKLPRHERPHRLDVPGALLLALASVSLLLALSWGGVRYPWSSAPILALLAASAAFWVLFSLRLLRAREPLIPLTVLGNPIVRGTTTFGSCSMGTLIALTIFLPVYFEVVLRLTPSQSGLALIPLTIGTVFGATLCGQTMGRVTHYKRVPMAGLSIAVVCSVVLTFFAEAMPLAAVEALLAAISVGIGTSLPISMVALQNSVVPHEMGTATATMNFFRQLAGALMVALFGAIVLGGRPGASAGPDSLSESLPGAAAGSFHWMFAVASVSLATALLFLARMEERPLRGGAPHAPEPPVAA
jgi:EmrB/QacA subfamily drug resistance transporter